MKAMETKHEVPQASTLIIRLVHEPAGGISGVIERVRTGIKERFESREALCRLLGQIVARGGDSGGSA